ncbi:hypothetical protein VN1338_32500 [Helicobacter pylori]
MDGALGDRQGDVVQGDDGAAGGGELLAQAAHVEQSGCVGHRNIIGSYGTHKQNACVTLHDPRVVQSWANPTLHDPRVMQGW